MGFQYPVEAVPRRNVTDPSADPTADGVEMHPAAPGPLNVVSNGLS